MQNTVHVVELLGLYVILHSWWKLTSQNSAPFERVTERIEGINAPVALSKITTREFLTKALSSRTTFGLLFSYVSTSFWTLLPSNPHTRSFHTIHQDTKIVFDYSGRLTRTRWVFTRVSTMHSISASRRTASRNSAYEDHLRTSYPSKTLSTSYLLGGPCSGNSPRRPGLSALGGVTGGQSSRRPWSTTL